MQDPSFGTRFGLASLAVWRLTHLLAEEDGPFDAVVRLRRRAGSGQLGALMDCFYCLSVWIAVPAGTFVAARRRDLPITAVALSGAACLLERITTEPGSAPAESLDDGGVVHELLWQEAEGA